MSEQVNKKPTREKDNLSQRPTNATHKEEEITALRKRFNYDVDEQKSMDSKLIHINLVPRKRVFKDFPGVSFEPLALSIPDSSTSWFTLRTSAESIIKRAHGISEDNDIGVELFHDGKLANANLCLSRIAEETKSKDGENGFVSIKYELREISRWNLRDEFTNLAVILLLFLIVSMYFNYSLHTQLSNTQTADGKRTELKISDMIPNLRIHDIARLVHRIYKFCSDLFSLPFKK